MRLFLILCVVLWAAAWGWSLIGLAVTEPTGDGFTRGLNRVRALFFWQFVAATLAFPIWLLGVPRAASGLARWAARVPIILALLPALAIAGTIAIGLLAP